MNEPSSDYAQSWEGNEGNEQNCSNTTGLGDSLFQNQFRYCLHTSKSSLAEHKKSVKFIQALKPNFKKMKVQVEMLAEYRAFYVSCAKFKK